MEISIYYGVSYPVEQAETVASILGMRYPREPTRHGRIGISLVRRGSIEIISTGEMRYVGSRLLSQADASQPCLRFHQSELDKAEMRYPDAVRLLTDIYNAVIAGCRECGCDDSQIRDGWVAGCHPQ